MRRRFLISAAVVAAVTCTAIMYGCTGPEGAQGIPGPKGELTVDTIYVKRDTVIIVKDTLVVLRDSVFVIKYDTLTIYRDTLVRGDTIMMNTKCQRCHNDAQKVPAKQFQWASTDHAIGPSLAAARGKSNCARCHSGNGFITQTVKGKPKADIDTLNMNNVNCRACHKVHTNFDSTDWALTTIAKVGVTVKTANMSDTINMGKANLCINCHQAYVSNIVDTAKTDSVKVTNRFAPHFGMQASMLTGRGGCESICSTATKPADSINAVAKLTNGCLECHVSKLDGKSHFFKPSKAAVAAAAASVNATATFNADTIRAKIDTLMVEVRDSLINRNILKKDTTAQIRVAMVPTATGTMFPKKIAGACWNYLYVAEDLSHGVHNYQYALWLLQGSRAALKP